MYKKTSAILDEICFNKMKEVKIKMKELSIQDLKNIIKKNKFAKRDFLKSLKKKKLSLIAEIKRSSPSNKGVIFKENFNVAQIAKIYNKNGANAISVITEKKFFKGSIDYLKIAKESSNLPILRKDFIMHSWQVYESKAYGADAILLIASILEKKQLQNLYNIARELDLDCLVEIHNARELKFILNIKPKIIGINNRDLKTMKINLNNFVKLSKIIPKNILKVAESGITSFKDAEKMRNVEADAILVGTFLIKSNNIKQAIDNLKI
ncbi:MAG: indole-3-glycerol phosphate synthase TrpC [Patescibacteria group bacterium]|nr:indole-3-glycerol phosphate synthase TrpC [Patescibacteria group bacterium]